MTTRITQQVGASFGIAIAAVTLQTQLSHGVVGAFHQAFWWSVGITLAALIPAALLPGHDRASIDRRRRGAVDPGVPVG
jgi:hypothetical protein